MLWTLKLCSSEQEIHTCCIMALNDFTLSRAVRASPDAEKQNVLKNPAMPETPAATRYKHAHNLTSSSAIVGLKNA